MKKLLITTIVLTIFIFMQTTSFAQPLSIPQGCSYILIDSKTGQVIAERDADKKLRPASTTKVMTAIVALENGSLDQEMKISKEAVADIGIGGMNIGIMPDEDNLTLENLLNVMLIKSANESANIIAENVSESREKFIELMNKKAQELGAYNTFFLNTCGKDDKKEEANHLTTARDMAAIARYAMCIPKFREIVAKEYYKDLPITNKHSKWEELRTTNKLLWYNNKYPYTIGENKYNYTVNGIKTGFTSAAGNNLATSAVNDEGMELIAVILHVTESNKVFSYAKELFKYGFSNYSLQKVSSAGNIVKSVAVEDAKDYASLELVAASDLVCAMPLNKDEWNVTTKENVNTNIKAPVKKGDILGNVEFIRNGTVLGKVDVIAASDVEKDIKIIKREKQEEKKDSFNVGTLFLIVTPIVVFFLLSNLFRKMRKLKRKM